jgi:D-aspartate ligase
MDIRRGAPLPLLAYLDAAGETAALRNAVALAQTEPEDAKMIFYDRFTLRALLLAKTMTSRISREECAYWRAWIRENTNRSVDFAADGADSKPGIVHALSEVYLGLKAFPRFLRSTPRLPAVTAHAAKGYP